MSNQPPPTNRKPFISAQQEARRDIQIGWIVGPILLFAVLLGLLLFVSKRGTQDLTGVAVFAVLLGILVFLALGGRSSTSPTPYGESVRKTLSQIALAILMLVGVVAALIGLLIGMCAPIWSQVY